MIVVYVILGIIKTILFIPYLAVIAIVGTFLELSGINENFVEDAMSAYIEWGRMNKQQ